MKIRNGFVSNSSSSSFIIGIARITDINAFMVWKRKMGCRDIKIVDGNDNWGYRIGIGKVYVDAPINSGSEISLPCKEGDDIAIVCIGNNEGDTEFMEYGELNYDIDLAHFDEVQQEIYNTFKSSKFFGDSKAFFGAGRNG